MTAKITHAQPLTLSPSGVVQKPEPLLTAPEAELEAAVLTGDAPHVEEARLGDASASERLAPYKELWPELSIVYTNILRQVEAPDHTWHAYLVRLAP